jgi:nitrogen fixation protein NifB
VLLCARIGFEPWRPLENAGIQPNSEHAMESIAEALPAVYREWQKSGRLHATPARATAQGGFA